MNKQAHMVYGIGNPLIDIIVSVEEQDIIDLGIHKGTMALIDSVRMQELMILSKNVKHPTPVEALAPIPSSRSPH